MKDWLAAVLGQAGATTLAGVPDGYEAVVLARLAQKRGDVLHIASDDARLARLAEALRFFAPDLTVLDLPGWDCVPYDRASPHGGVVARRIRTLAQLAPRRRLTDPPRLVLTTPAAVLQRLPRQALIRDMSLILQVGKTLDRNGLIAYCLRNGYSRAETVMEAGEFAIRGDIIDLYPSGQDYPVRIDCFDTEIEKIREFDPVTQRSVSEIPLVTLLPASEILLDDASVARFRSGYRAAFGTVGGDDPLYEAISSGAKYGGMEHWLPLFHDGLDPLTAWMPEALITADERTEAALAARQDQISEYYQARVEIRGHGELGAPYHPLPPDCLYIPADEWARSLSARPHLQFWPFAPGDQDGAQTVVDAGGRPGRDFADVRAQPGANLYDAVRLHLAAEMNSGRRILLAAWTEGSRDRLGGLLREHGCPLRLADDLKQALAVPAGTAALAVLGLERGFTAPDLVVLTEQDILGDRLSRPVKQRRRAESFLVEASSLAEGDLVVHIDHGIGRYDGLITLAVSGAPHDCLRVLYDGGDKLFVPVENIDMLSRYGSEQAGVALDKLGGASWQSRKAKLKKRIQDMAEQLVALAAQRQIRPGAVMTPAEGLYDEFCARFPYAETDDQARAIGDVIDDLAAGRPMDRLICGDVGFGKTEVALRAAFVAVMEGQQVAVVVPTTLLARQHYQTFTSRFAGMPVRVAQLSRMVTAKQASQVRKDLAEGQIDVIVGTHALLAKTISFKRLGLLIVDEEQHFGVSHKERLKQLRQDVHVLTLTATPIPRTLQLALSGVREMSVIATPPVDRLVVRTFVLPYDGVVIREAILRERYRGGQVFYVCPRLADMDKLLADLKLLVPDLRVALAHGRLSPTELEEVMTAFADGGYDLLLSTNIIESGLDMPRVNTIIIHRADMFGLSQLYQMRGRVGRGKQRGYAYLTLPPRIPIGKTAEKRLQVMQTLDSLGAGFTLASHDLDIRGAGNLLGDEQSGHIREVGIELYQSLIEDAVVAARSGKTAGQVAADDWAPQISLGMPVLIPDSYVADLSVRLGLYRRIGLLNSPAEIDALAAELIDRFGKIPQEVDNLLKIVFIKVLCKQSGIAKVDAGPKGAVISFRNNSFPNPVGLVRYLSQQIGFLKLRPDHKLVAVRAWEDSIIRLREVTRLLQKLQEISSETN